MIPRIQAYLILAIVKPTMLTNSCYGNQNEISPNNPSNAEISPALACVALSRHFMGARFAMYCESSVLSRLIKNAAKKLTMTLMLTRGRLMITPVTPKRSPSRPAYSRDCALLTASITESGRSFVTFSIRKMALPRISSRLILKKWQRAIQVLHFKDNSNNHQSNPN